MHKLPRWTIHNGIKYSPKRSILKVCPCCKKPFLKKGKGNKKYCNSECREKTKKEQTRKINQKIIKNRDPIKHADYMREMYHINRLNEIQVCPISQNLFTGIGYKTKYPTIEYAKEAKKQQIQKSNQKMIKNRDSLEHAAYMRELYHKNLLKKNKKPLGTITVPPIPVQESTTGGGGNL